MQKKKAKQYAHMRDEQFSLFENYARQNGINSKFLLVFKWIYNNPEGITQEFYLQADLFQQAGHPVHC